MVVQWRYWVVICLGIFCQLNSVVGRAEETRQTLTEQGISVFYPIGLEAQAHVVASTVAEVLPACRARYAPIYQEIDEHPVELGERIADIIGCPEDLPQICATLSQCRRINRYMCALDTHYTLIREADLPKSSDSYATIGGIKIQYDQKTDTFVMSSTLTSSDNWEKYVDDSSIPVLVKSDGTINQSTLTDRVKSLLEKQLYELCAVGFHEAAEAALVFDAHLYHPFTRWFNDGVANWVMLQMIHQLAPSLSVEYQMISLPSADTVLWRSQVNLPAWAQLNVSLPGDPMVANRPLLTAYYAYATELIDRCFAKAPAGALAAVITRLKGHPNPTPAEICGAIHAETGVDAAALLREYMPAEVRQGLAKRHPAQLGRQAEMMLREHRDSDAIALYRQALAMTPLDIHARGRLAWILCKTGAAQTLIDPHLKIITTICRNQQLSPKTFASSNDANAYYLCGRAAQLANDFPQAREQFQRVLQLNPQHVATQAALQEMDKQSTSP